MVGIIHFPYAASISDTETVLWVMLADAERGWVPNVTTDAVLEILLLMGLDVTYQYDEAAREWEERYDVSLATDSADPDTWQKTQFGFTALESLMRAAKKALE